MTRKETLIEELVLMVKAQRRCDPNSGRYQLLTTSTIEGKALEIVEEHDREQEEPLVRSGKELTPSWDAYGVNRSEPNQRQT